MKIFLKLVFMIQNKNIKNSSQIKSKFEKIIKQSHKSLQQNQQQKQQKMSQLFDSISNFFTAIINIYTQIPYELVDQLKTMQAFLKGYNQKQLFLIQNFVRRLETKAQKVKYMSKRNKHQLKTQPNLVQEQNKQNTCNSMNVFHKQNSTSLLFYEQNKQRMSKNNEIKNSEIQKYLKGISKLQQAVRQTKPIQKPIDIKKVPQVLQCQIKSKLNYQYHKKNQTSLDKQSLNASQSLINLYFQNQSYDKQNESQQYKELGLDSRIQPHFASITIDSKPQKNELIKKNIKQIRQMMQNNDNIVEKLEEIYRSDFNAAKQFQIYQENNV